MGAQKKWGRQGGSGTEQGRYGDGQFKSGDWPGKMDPGRGGEEEDKETWGGGGAAGNW